ncbi:hypothetical protein G5V65_11140 [Rhodobacter sp. HX-7-19]|uniref:Uncharacterized protein n=1 Tax=Paragemmobacter kunshanensis TaxID=2583234 RepID=A0A6M1TZ08_9RHOB|nr:hypothetical protein [Rhodobacter kunshanensis]NGQ91452.1 hypothetical protein [Rhodobacter kunshanensis]
MAAEVAESPRRRVCQAHSIPQVIVAVRHHGYIAVVPGNRGVFVVRYGPMAEVSAIRCDFLQYLASHGKQLSVHL